ncbi:MAG: AAA family ATPase, partial [Bacteroides ovatus]|nr:AAA family ATPase [Bacteroides ovatus]
MSNKSIIIPVNNKPTKIESVQNFVIVGANGSGKSHLGAWIEQQSANGEVLRISAQRALSIPDSITIKSEEAAWNKIYYGEELHHDKNYKWNWGNGLTTKLIDDYDSVLSAIFARLNKEDRAYVIDCKDKEKRGETKADVPQMIIDKITSIWNAIYPHRQIILEDAKIKAKTTSSEEYHAKEMSDGERVTIYLLGQCLIAPNDMTIIIDEPEIHLHKSIMYRLWDKIEEFCPNKTFIYITHDLDFAASRKEATKIWVKSYFGNNRWDIKILDPDENIPDSLMFEVLGNRKPVLFVEGERGSYDNQLYPFVYSNYNIIPCHDCSKVIEITKSFNNERIKNMHNYSIKGLIDRDYMTEAEISCYKESNIYTLDVAEVENLYLIEDIIKLVAENQALEPNETFNQVKQFLFNKFKREYDLQLCSICSREIRHKLQCYTKPSENTMEALEAQAQKIVNSIDIPQIYNQSKQKIDAIVTSQDYDNLLKIYNRKSLHRCHPRIINFCNQKFYGGDLVIMTRDKGEEDVICAIRTAKGNHSRSHMNQREIDVIKEEVLPNLSYETDEIGVIAPYNKQVDAVKSALEEDIDVATVHKFQGREKDAIIMTTVDDVITSFSDDPNLLNVAVSRAKSQFYLVVSGNEQPKDCNISNLIAYIEYNNGTVSTSKIHSIFDYLYEQYTDARIAYLKKHKKISEYDSENLTFALLEDILKENINMRHLNIICHLPLYMLIQDYSLLNEEESKYA